MNITLCDGCERKIDQVDFRVHIYDPRRPTQTQESFDFHSWQCVVRWAETNAAR